MHALECRLRYATKAIVTPHDMAIAPIKAVVQSEGGSCVDSLPHDVTVGSLIAPMIFALLRPPSVRAACSTVALARTPTESAVAFVDAVTASTVITTVMRTDDTSILSVTSASVTPASCANKAAITLLSDAP